MKKRTQILALLLSCLLLMSLGACTSSNGQNGESSANNAGEANTPDETAGADWDYIADKGELIIGITYFEPMNYLDASGNLTGFETDFATAVCEILGVTPKFQEISWSAKETELKAMTIDCIWNAMTIKPELQENLAISQPYMKNAQVLVVKNENASYADGVDGLTIAAEAGSAGETVATSEDFFANTSFVAVDTQAKSLLEVASGMVDGCVIDYVASIGMLGEGTDYAGLTALETVTFADEEYGIAVRKGEETLIGKINDAINQLIADGTLQEIAAKYNLESRLIVS